MVFNMAFGGAGKINNPRSVYGRKGKRSEKSRKRKANKEVKKNVDALTTAHILRKNRTNPNANITLSGKKKRLLLKQLKREEAEKRKMDVAVVETPETEQTSKKVEKMDVS